MTDFPTLLYTSTCEIPTLLYIPEAWKRYPFRAELPRIGRYRESSCRVFLLEAPEIVSSLFWLVVAANLFWHVVAWKRNLPCLFVFHNTKGFSPFQFCFHAPKGRETEYWTFLLSLSIVLNTGVSRYGCSIATWNRNLTDSLGSFPILNATWTSSVHFEFLLLVFMISNPEWQSLLLPNFSPFVFMESRSSS